MRIMSGVEILSTAEVVEQDGLIYTIIERVNEEN